MRIEKIFPYSRVSSLPICSCIPSAFITLLPYPENATSLSLVVSRERDVTLMLRVNKITKKIV